MKATDNILKTESTFCKLVSGSVAAAMSTLLIGPLGIALAEETASNPNSLVSNAGTQAQAEIATSSESESDTSASDTNIVVSENIAALPDGDAMDNTIGGIGDTPPSDSAGTTSPDNIEAAGSEVNEDFTMFDQSVNAADNNPNMSSENARTENFSKTTTPAATPNKDRLARAIKSAKAAMKGVLTSSNGLNVPAKRQWTTLLEKTTFKKAIQRAQAAYENKSITQKQIDNAKATLEKATSKYKQAKCNGAQASTAIGNSIVTAAKKLASDPEIGYSYSAGEAGHEKDVLCYLFTAKAVNKAMPRRHVNIPDRHTNMSEQESKLEQLGFTKHVITDHSTMWNDPSLIPGSIIFANDQNGNPKHVEIYAGRYYLGKGDKYNNPVADSRKYVVRNGKVLNRSILIGAKVRDRAISYYVYPTPHKQFNVLNENDKGSRGGDQYQNGKNNWWCGEVSGGYAKYRDSNTGWHSDYWDVYYAPEKISLMKFPTRNVKYTGKAQKPYSGSIKIKTPLATTLREGVDYKVSYKNNKRRGTATAIIKGIKPYRGAVRVQFKIR